MSNLIRIRVPKVKLFIGLIFFILGTYYIIKYLHVTNVTTPNNTPYETQRPFISVFDNIKDNMRDIPRPLPIEMEDQVKEKDGHSIKYNEVEDKNQSLNGSPKESMKEEKPEADDISFVEEERKYFIPRPRVQESVQIINQPQMVEGFCELKNLVIILCMGSAQNVAYRNAIRETWGAKHKEYNQKYKVISSYSYQVIFVIGRTNDENRNLRKEILEEVAQHKDILEVDFREGKYGYTRKFIAGLNWIHSINCYSLKFVLRVLDDIFVNVPPILDWLNAKFLSTQKGSGIYLGDVVKQDKPIRNIQDPLYTSQEDYPENTFPNYIKSPLYFFSRDVILCLRNEVANISIIPMEDAFIGLLAHKCNVKPTHNEHFVLLAKPDNMCHHRRMFFIGRLQPMEVLEVFRNLERVRKGECDNVDENLEL